MEKRLLPYDGRLKNAARDLRRNLTDSEQALWSRLRRKQILGVQFYRQKPIGPHIPDFFAPKARLIIEVDGSQHLAQEHTQRDRRRDDYFVEMGIQVLRFDSREVLSNISSVMEFIFETVKRRLEEIPLDPPLRKGEGKEIPRYQRG